MAQIFVQNEDKIKNNVKRIKDKEFIFTIWQLNESNCTDYIETISLKRNAKGKDEGPEDKVILSNIVELPTLKKNIHSKETLLEYFNVFKRHIKEKECCYTVYDFGYYNEQNIFRNKICLIVYVPDGVANAKLAFTYSSSSIKLANTLDVDKCFTINSYADVNYEHFLTFLPFK